MLLETAGDRTTKPPKSLNLALVEGMDYLLDGFIPANDQTIVFGKAGTGKTTSAVSASKAVAFGGFLDHPHPAKQGKVLFIGSDSGAGPVKAVLQSAGLSDHPFFKEGPAQRFHVWASDRIKACRHGSQICVDVCDYFSSSRMKASTWWLSIPANL